VAPLLAGWLNDRLWIRDREVGVSRRVTPAAAKLPIFDKNGGFSTRIDRHPRNLLIYMEVSSKLSDESSELSDDRQPLNQLI
jgi:hypothetical protein